MGPRSIAVSIAGTLYRYQSLDGPSVDFLWLITKALAVSVAELNVGLLCACMPVAFVLFQDFAQRTEAGYWRLFSYVRSRLGGSSPDITTSKGAEMENHQLDPLVRVPGESLQSCSEQALSVQSGRKDSRSQHSLG
ncbi:hypothetical protein F4861DRAFT_375650 [Xylaria intraflava]|nr:hypothetical protein F4861DRAFT_375650 [Xylaria intraflava]